MNLQCRHCQTVEDDARICYVAQIPLCPACKANPPLHVIARRKLAATYDPAAIRDVCDMVEKLERDYAILKDMNEPKPTYTTRPVVRLDEDGTPWLWLHGSRMRRLQPGEVSGSMGHVLQEGDKWLRGAANEPVRVDDWDPVETVKRVAGEKRIE